MNKQFFFLFVHWCHDVMRKQKPENTFRVRILDALPFQLITSCTVCFAFRLAHTQNRDCLQSKLRVILYGFAIRPLLCIETSNKTCTFYKWIEVIKPAHAWCDGAVRSSMPIPFNRIQWSSHTHAAAALIQFVCQFTVNACSRINCECNLCQMPAVCAANRSQLVCMRRFRGANEKRARPKADSRIAHSARRAHTYWMHWT